MSSNGCPKVGKLLSRALAATWVGVVSLHAGAVDLPFSQTAGFFAGGGTSLSLVATGGAPVAGHGGLEFSTAVVAPPGPPAGTSTAPDNVWAGIAWGCNLGSTANCANGGVLGVGTGFPDSFGSTNRSALRVAGQFGTLNDSTWTDVTVIGHHNIVIDLQSNALRTVQIHSLLRLGNGGTIVDTPAPSIVNVTFVETPNVGACSAVPAPGAPVNPLGSACDDYAIISGLDLTSFFIPAGALGNAEALNVDFRLFATATAGALVCDGSASQPAQCAGYAGPDVIIYTKEGSDNTLSVQAKLRPADVVKPLPLFVIGDVEPHAVGDVVNFWGAQWWKNNFMSGFVSHGVASFKGYANHAQDFCGGKWESRPGNSSEPPAVIPDEVAIIVTDTVLKDGPNISGTIKEILLVKHDGGYGPNPGHRGNGPVTKVICKQ